ncbi:MAG: SPOR domain-containing protein [Gammaproteobacteria bacterium]
MSPILLDHPKLKWILLAVGLLVIMMFFGGYILGFEKSNNKWIAQLEPVGMALPNADVTSLAVVEAQKPEFEEPGASIDVDSVDDEDDHVVTVADNSDANTGIVESTVIKVAMAKPVKPMIDHAMKEPAEEISTLKVVTENASAEVSSAINDTTEQAVVSDNIAAINETRKALLAIVSGIDGSSQNESEIAASSDTASEALTMVDDASEETARYSIQVGMYSSAENAQAKVDQLLNANLNAYLHNYKNKKDEVRYNVRFGYFSSFKRGLKALNIYEKNFAGSGYVARIER